MSKDKDEQDNIYCGIGKIPKGKRRGRVMECVQRKQVRYFGEKKVDKRLLHHKFVKGETREDVLKKLIPLDGRRKKLRKDLDEILNKLKKPKKGYDIEKLKEQGRELREKLKKTEEEVAELKQKLKTLESRKASTKKKSSKKQKVVKKRSNKIAKALKKAEDILKKQFSNTSAKYRGVLLEKKKLMKPVKKKVDLMLSKRLAEVEKIFKETRPKKFNEVKKVKPKKQKQKKVSITKKSKRYKSKKVSAKKKSVRKVQPKKSMKKVDLMLSKRLAEVEKRFKETRPKKYSTKHKELLKEREQLRKIKSKKKSVKKDFEKYDQAGKIKVLKEYLKEFNDLIEENDDLDLGSFEESEKDIERGLNLFEKKYKNKGFTKEEFDDKAYDIYANLKAEIDDLNNEIEDLRNEEEEGGDFFFELKGKGITEKIFRKLSNEYRKRAFPAGKARQLLEGEIHPTLPNFAPNFCGPQTRIDLPEVRNFKPFNEVDAVCKQHDIDYLNASKQPDKNKRAELIREADEKMLKDLEKYKHVAGYTLAKLAIKGKIKVEDLLPQLSKLISPSHFGKKKGAGIDLTDKRVLETKPRSAYPKEVNEAIKLISINESDSTPFGSYIYKAQPYANDIDVIEEVRTDVKKITEKDKHEIAKRMTKHIQNIVREVKKIKGAYIADFKAGVRNTVLNYLISDKFIPACITQKDYEKYINTEKFKNYVAHVNSELYAENLISDQENDRVESLIKNYITPEDHEEIYKIFRKALIIRWTPEEILKGRKQHERFKTDYYNLETKILEDPTITKLDIWLPIDGSYVEVTNLFYFILKDKKGYEELLNGNTINFEESLKKEVNKYFTSTYFKPFKLAKRMFALARLLKDKKIAFKIVKLFRSDVGLLNKVLGEVDLILNMYQKLKTPPKSLINQLDFLKEKLSVIIDVKFNESFVYGTINDIVNKKLTKEQVIKKLEQLHEYLQKIVNRDTILYLKKVKLLPPPKKLLPNGKFNPFSIAELLPEGTKTLSK